MGRTGTPQVRKGGPFFGGFLAALALTLIVLVWLLLDWSASILGDAPAMALALTIFGLSTWALTVFLRR